MPYETYKKHRRSFEGERTIQRGTKRKYGIAQDDMDVSKMLLKSTIMRRLIDSQANPFLAAAAGQSTFKNTLKGGNSSDVCFISTIPRSGLSEDKEYAVWYSGVFWHTFDLDHKLLTFKSDAQRKRDATKPCGELLAFIRTGVLGAIENKAWHNKTETERKADLVKWVETDKRHMIQGMLSRAAAHLDFEAVCNCEESWKPLKQIFVAVSIQRYGERQTTAIGASRNKGESMADPT